MLFIIPLLRINIFYQVDFEGEASSIAHFSFTYRYTAPDIGRMNHRTCRSEITIKEHAGFGCCVCVDWVAFD